MFLVLPPPEPPELEDPAVVAEDPDVVAEEFEPAATVEELFLELLHPMRATVVRIATTTAIVRRI